MRFYVSDTSERQRWQWKGALLHVEDIYLVTEAQKPEFLTQSQKWALPFSGEYIPSSFKLLLVSVLSDRKLGQKKFHFQEHIAGY